MVISVVVFDVNETLSDMAPMAARFADVGAPGHLAALWFAGVLRDGFALTAAGGQQSFADVAEGGLRGTFAGLALDRPVDDAVAHVLAGFSALDLHPDVAAGVREFRERGLRLVTLSNGSAKNADRLLSTAGIRGEFEELMSVEDAGAWKPAPAAYAYAARRCGVEPAQMLLLAVHPWDIDGAARAGMDTGWVSRRGSPYPSYFNTPTYVGATIGAVAAALPATLSRRTDVPASSVGRGVGRAAAVDLREELRGPG